MNREDREDDVAAKLAELDRDIEAGRVSQFSGFRVYYCLAAGAIGHAEAPGALRRNRPDPIPVLVMGRLAIHRDYHQKGLGTALLRDAILRTLQAAEITGVTALLVHALSEQAKRFYRSCGFMESPVQPMTLCLPLSTVEKTLREMDR